MNNGRIVVIGSSNTDMVVKGDHIPQRGETVLGGTFFMNAGGKGANQAVAAARLGGAVDFVAKVGDDMFGRESRTMFAKEGIGTSHLFTDFEAASGVALIFVGRDGENSIMVSSGANARLMPDDILIAMESVVKSDLLLMQLEVPIETVLFAAAEASDRGKPVVLNPAPACELPKEIFRYLYLITPNQTETEILTGIKVMDAESAEMAAQKFFSLGVKNVVITMGSKGAYLRTADYAELVPAFKVEAVDTTAAGDVFNGALCVALCEGKDLRESVIFASRAASISVTRLGAQSSAPYRNEIST